MVDRDRRPGCALRDVVAVVSIALFVAWRLGAFRTERASVPVEDVLLA
jgi:hypothetical protein